VMLVIQGLAVVHGIVALAAMSTGWLVATYVLMLMIPQLAVPALCLTGLVDAWLDFRGRFSGKP